VLSEKKVVRIEAIGKLNGEEGYRIMFKNSTGIFKGKKRLTSRGVVFSGGVLGTVRLLLNLKRRYLPGLSEQVGVGIRTNNESLALVHSKQKEKGFSRGWLFLLLTDRQWGGAS